MTTARVTRAATRFAPGIAALRLVTPTAGRSSHDLDRGRYPGWRMVQEQQAKAQTRQRCSAMVSARRLARRKDQLHLSTASQRILRPKLAIAMDRLTGDGCGGEKGPPT